MLQAGSPLWTLWLFGAVSASTGFLQWHQLESPTQFFSPATNVPADVALGVAIAALGAVSLALFWG